MKKKTEFSKKVVLWVLVLTTLTVAGSFLLAAFDKQTVESLTSVIVTSLAVIIVTYCVKSLGEKASRNRHHLDANGTPMEQTDPNETQGKG